MSKVEHVRPEFVVFRVCSVMPFKSRYDLIFLLRELLKLSFPENAAVLDEIHARIGALEKLSAADLNKLDPKDRKRIEHAIASQARKTLERNVPFRSVKRIEQAAPTYPTRSQINSDSGPRLLEMWLLYQLLTPHSEYSHEVQPAFIGGGGASGGWTNPGAVPEASTGSDIPTGIEPQYALGAASFS